MPDLQNVSELGQSIWLDDIRRSMLWDGSLYRLVHDLGVTGLTTNPSIFREAIASTDEYTPALRAAGRTGAGAAAVLEHVIVQDVQNACDVLTPVYRQSAGRDGFVSLEVSPHLAHDTDGTIAEARRLWDAVARDNLMIKIPATLEGLAAIEQTVAMGFNVNVTLLFAVETYQWVAQAYLAGLDRYAAGGGDVSRVASVASFFVSRIDTLVDRKLEARIAAAEGQEAAEALVALAGKVAVANARLAYAAYGQVMASDRWAALEARGARPQRLLWASTSTKNPAYPDTLYVDALIGPSTVNTVPRATLEAFLDHGKPQLGLPGDVESARALMARLSGADISMKAVTDQLLSEGLASFTRAYDELVETVRVRNQA